MLFFVVNSPNDMARMHLGQKHVTEQAVDNWKQQRGYDLPLLINSNAEGLNQIKKTIFYQKSLRLFAFDFGISDSGRNIGEDIQERISRRSSVLYLNDTGA
jgi:peptide/nickel transport system permease protein